jgi:hypothetical protein
MWPRLVVVSSDVTCKFIVSPRIISLIKQISVKGLEVPVEVKPVCMTFEGKLRFAPNL